MTVQGRHWSLCLLSKSAVPFAYISFVSYLMSARDCETSAVSSACGMSFAPAAMPYYISVMGLLNVRKKPRRWRERRVHGLQVGAGVPQGTKARFGQSEGLSRHSTAAGQVCSFHAHLCIILWRCWLQSIQKNAEMCCLPLHWAINKRRELMDCSSFGWFYTPISLPLTFCLKQKLLNKSAPWINRV